MRITRQLAHNSILPGIALTQTDSKARSTCKFDLSWKPSEDSDLESYKVYGGLASAESVGTPSGFIATIPAGTEEYATTFGTSEIGLGATFKVYVVLDTGNEAGSNLVTIFVPSGVVPEP